MNRTHAQRIEQLKANEAAQVDAWKKESGQAYRERRAVRHASRKAVKRGTIERQGCEVCGAPAEIHHPNYSKRFAIRFLCKEHHLPEHGKNLQSKNGSPIGSPNA